MCWVMAIILLAISNPAGDHFSLCILKMSGFDFCPGCGLGHSIGWLFRLQFEKSIDTHLLGIPALLIIIYRIFQLLIQSKNNFYESKITYADPRH